MRKKGFSKIVVLIIVLIAVIAGGIVIYQRYLTPSQTENTSISNWQTYQNERYEFEVKYPERWYAFDFPEAIADSLQTEKIIFSNLSKEEVKNFNIVNENTDNNFDEVYSFAVNIIQSSLEDWLKEQISLSELMNMGLNFKTKDIVLGNNKAYQIDFSFSYLGPEADFRAMVIPHKEKSVIYLIETMWPEECRKGKWNDKCEVFHTIASSFKLP